MANKRTEHELYCGKRLKQHRRKLNFTRDDLEFETAGEVSARTIWRWERQGIPVNVQIKKLEAVCKALQLRNGLEDLEKVEPDYLNSLTLDIVQNRLETGADEIKANEIVKIFEFVSKRQDEEPDADDPTKAPYDPLKDLVEKDEDD